MSPQSSQPSDIFTKFLDMLQNAEAKHHTVEYFASQLCITPKYLTLVCKQKSGKTALEWITEYTLSDIKYYLKSTSLSMKEIADRTGFPNTSFFGTYVRRHFGMTPMQYRAGDNGAGNQAMK